MTAALTHVAGITASMVEKFHLPACSTLAVVKKNMVHGYTMEGWTLESVMHGKNVGDERGEREGERGAGLEGLGISILASRVSGLT